MTVKHRLEWISGENPNPGMPHGQCRWRIAVLGYLAAFLRDGTIEEAFSLELQNAHDQTAFH
jgi:hypothetical protein